MFFCKSVEYIESQVFVDYCLKLVFSFQFNFYFQPNLESISNIQFQKVGLSQIVNIEISK